MFFHMSWYNLIHYNGNFESIAKIHEFISTCYNWFYNSLNELFYMFIFIDIVAADIICVLYIFDKKYLNMLTEPFCI